MKAKLSIFLAFILLSSFALVQAEEVDPFAITSDDTEITTSSDGTSIDTGDTSVDTSGDGTSIGTSDNNVTTDYGVGGVDVESSSSIQAPSLGVLNYPEISCNEDYFIANSCGQCFEGGQKLAGEKITGLNDSWTNPNSTEQIIYKDEQVMPELVNLGGENTIWLSNPEDTNSFWKYSDEVVWMESSQKVGSEEYLLEGGGKVNLLEADLGASYALQSTDKQENDPIGLLTFTLNYHDTDEFGDESGLKTHTECVVYNAGPGVPVETPETPEEVTQVKTGPESFVLILIALLLSLGLFKYRKRS